MARKRRMTKKSPLTVTVRRVGETGMIPRFSGKGKGKGFRGPSKAMQRMTGAVSSARKAAARAGQISRMEPTRVAVGTLAGAVAGKIGADMLHDSAVKTPAGAIGKNEAMANAAAGGIAAAAGVAVAMMGAQSTTKRYVVQGLSHIASFMAGSANALSNAKKKPVQTVAGADDDPFRSDGGDTGAPRRQRAQKRRQMIANRMAAQLRSEDPTTSGTEGPELEEYCAGVLDDAIEDVEGFRDVLMAEDVEEVGFPIAAAGMTKLIKKLMSLLKKDKKDKAEEGSMTDTVLELEGMAPEEIEVGRKPQVLKDLKAERRALKKDLRRQKRAARKMARQERRAARQERREEKKEWKEDKPLSARQERKVERKERKIAKIEDKIPIIRTVEPDEYDDENEDVIIIPSDEDIAEYGN